MAWDVDKEEFLEAWEEGKRDWVWSALKDAQIRAQESWAIAKELTTQYDQLSARVHKLELERAKLYLEFYEKLGEAPSTCVFKPDKDEDESCSS